MNNESGSTAHGMERFSATVNSQILQFSNPDPDARQILNAADFMPADDCILVQVFAHGSHAIGLDETVDLRDPGTETFWAFKADRVFNFTVDERGFEWGAPMIDEPLLREIAHVKADEVLVLERESLPDKVLDPDDKVDLAKAGTEHLRIKNRLVTVYFKDVEFHIPAGNYTTEELMAKFPIEEGYLLNLLEDDVLVTLKPGQKIHVKNGMHFFSQPPGGGSS
jgi:hypothetical protein